MNRQQRQAMIAAMESALAELGVEMYSGAQRLNGFLEAHRPLLEACFSRERLDAYFASAGEQDEARIGSLVMLISAAPGLLQELMATIKRDVAAKTPKGPVGRPERLTPEVRRRIVETISEYSKAGVTIGAAQLRVAQQLGVSKRTVQGAWQHRRELAEQPFQSVGDAWKFIEGMLDLRS